MNPENNNILENNKMSSFELKKEDISGGYLDFNLGKKIFIFFSQKGDYLNNTDLLNKSNKIKKLILNKLSELNIKDDNIENIKSNINGKLIITYLDRNSLKNIYFNLLDKDKFYLGNLADIKEKRERQNKDTIEVLEASDNILEAMNYILEKNNKEFFGGELSNEDILDTNKFGVLFKGLNIKGLKEYLDDYFEGIKKIGLDNMPKKYRKEYLKQKQKYFDILMGVGDKNEGVVKYLKTISTKDNVKNKIIDNSVNEIIDLSSNKEILIYLKEFHRRIDGNNYQSTSVEKAYIASSKSLHRKILDKFIKNNASDKDFLEYAKIITGRGKLEKGSIDEWKNSDIDDNLRDQENSNNAIFYIMNRKGGIVDRINNSEDYKNGFNDKWIENKKPEVIINNLKDNFYNKFGESTKKVKYFDKVLNESGYGDILNLENKKYSDLSLEQKTKLSVLYRVNTKLLNFSGSLNLDSFGELFNQVAKDYREDLTEKIEETFSSDNIFDSSFYLAKSASEFGLTGEQAEIYELFQDINGNGLFDLSDNSIEGLKTGGKFAGVVAVGVLAPFILLPTAGIVAQGAAAGAATTLASMIIEPKGYDTVEEAFVDISSDIAVGTLTGAAGGKLAQAAGDKIFKVKELTNKQKAGVFGVDLTFLGLIPEAGRITLINYIYHNYD